MRVRNWKGNVLRRLETFELRKKKKLFVLFFLSSISACCIVIWLAFFFPISPNKEIWSGEVWILRRFGSLAELESFWLNLNMKPYVLNIFFPKTYHYFLHTDIVITYNPHNWVGIFFLGLLIMMKINPYEQNGTTFFRWLRKYICMWSTG